MKKTKADLADILAKEHGISRQQAINFVNDFIATVSDELVAGMTVTLPTMGYMRMVDKAARNVHVGFSNETEKCFLMPALRRPKAFFSEDFLATVKRKNPSLSNVVEAA